MEPLLYTVEEAGRLLGLGRTKVYDLFTEGRLKRVRVGTKVLVPAAALAAFVEQLEADAS